MSPESTDYMSVAEWSLEQARIVLRAGAFEVAAREAGWGTPLPKGRARGIALAESFHSIVAQVAEVEVVDASVRVHRVVCAIDCGFAVNPDTVAAQMESGIIFGLSAALYGEIDVVTLADAIGHHGMACLMDGDRMALTLHVVDVLPRPHHLQLPRFDDIGPGDEISATTHSNDQ